MSSWILIAAGQSLFSAFNAVAPDRGRASDGSIGDVAHIKEGNSDHLPDEDYPALRNMDADHINEVHAIDVTTELNESDLTMEKCVQQILARCRSGAEKRLRYIIYNRRIWAADNSWREEAYHGTADPHINHAHFSFSYVTSLEASTVSWHLEDIPVALTAADKIWIQQQINAPYVNTGKNGLSETPVGHDVLSQQIPDGTRVGNPQDLAWRVLENMGKALLLIQAQNQQLNTQVTALTAKVNALSAPPAK